MNGGADFYGSTIKELRKEGELSLKTFLEMCEEEGIKPRKEYSGRFNLRVPSELHAELARRAAAEGRNLNQYLTDLLRDRM